MEDVQAAKEASALLSSVEHQIGGKSPSLHGLQPFSIASGTPVNWGAFKRSVVLPGQDVTQKVTLFGNEIQTGQGLRQESQRILATQSGVLQFQQPNVFWVEHRDHRYIPMKEDHVIGVITQQFSEAYTVDISSTSKAVLPTLAFDGASKRNHPNLPVGSLVYVRVESTSSFMEPVLSCQVVHGVKKDWMTGQAAFGELTGGHVVKCSLDLVCLIEVIGLGLWLMRVL